MICIRLRIIVVSKDDGSVSATAKFDRTGVLLLFEEILLVDRQHDDMASQHIDTNSSLMLKGCKKCKKIALSGPKCCVCGIVSHNSCASSLKNVRFVDLSTIVCCETNCIPSDLDTTFSGAKGTDFLDAKEVFYLKEIITNKDIIIKNQVDLICSLKNQIELLNSMLHPSVVNKPLPSMKEDVHTVPNKNINRGNSSLHVNKINTVEKFVDGQKPKVSKKTRNVEIYDNKVANANQQTSGISGVAVSNAISLAVANAKCEELIHLTDESSEVPFNKVVSKRKIKRQNKPIIGSNENLTTKIVTNKSFLHVYNLHPDFKPDELSVILKPKFPEVICDKINSRYPQYYSSFKVTIDACNFESAFNPDLWPKGAKINQFFHQRTRSAQEK